VKHRFTDLATGSPTTWQQQRSSNCLQTTPSRTHLQQQQGLTPTCCAGLRAVTLFGIFLGLLLSAHELSWWWGGKGTAKVGGSSSAVARPSTPGMH
jgi:hypothetical protein